VSLAALAACLAIVPGCDGTDKTNESQGLRGLTREPALRVGDVRLPDVGPVGDGRSSSLRAQPGRLRLVYFGYTSCPDVCPTTMVDVRAAVSRLPRGERDRISMAMVTVDPRRDTPAKLNGYLSHFFGTWSAYRTGDRRQLARAEKAFRASHKAARPNRHGSYDISHTAQVYAVDQDGEVRVEWPFGTSPDDIQADLAALLRSVPTEPSSQQTEIDTKQEQGGST
jgi:protein SCO1/2